ncbi:hypothetical protein [Demequina sp. NBRC 110052]|uniref:hypothetical protein n=1 Tax=Demequina sp. NBRC 110052 TaxID=1570341 RepID=UPI0009FC047A|nr:hypothetical protein [Demequina sp. NBRC 110052]
MSEPYDSLKQLHSLAGAGFDHTILRNEISAVEKRIARHRSSRAALASAAGIAILGTAAVGVLQWPGAPEAAPAEVPSASPSPTPAVVEESGAPGCAPATIVPGKPAGDIGGLEGWWNSTPVSLPCERWDESDPRILDHPDTVLINTVDYTMVEAAYRSDRAALGAYATLDGDFVVPARDPEWPANSLVLIDAATGEVLETYLLSGFAAPDYSLLNWPDWVGERLNSPLPASDVPPGYVVIAPSTPDASDEDLVIPQSYASRETTDVITVRLVAVLSGGGSETVGTGDASVVATDVFADGSIASLDDTTGVYTMSIPVLDEAHLILTGTDLDAVFRFVDAITTVEAG